MAKSEKSSRAFSFSIVASTLILTNAISLGIVAKWFIGIMPKFPGSSSTDPMLLYGLSSAGIVFGVLILFSALMLQRGFLNEKILGATIIAFSVPSVIMGGGFIIGFILGILGGTSVFSKKSKTQPPRLKTGV